MNNIDPKKEKRHIEKADDDIKIILCSALNKYGADAQIKMVFEEMAELQKALCKNMRGSKNEDHIAEEIADVMIMLDQMIILFDCKTTVNQYYKYKILRLLERMSVNIEKKEDDN